MNGPSTVWSFGTLHRLALGSLVAAGIYAVLLSSAVFMIYQLSTWVKLLIYALPWMMLWPVYSWGVLKDKARRGEIILMGLILILGAINLALSDHVYNSFTVMRYFLVSGVLALWTSMFLMADQAARKVFERFCCVCLAIFAPLEIITFLADGWWFPGLRHIYTLHPTPVGTMVMLLAAGPLSLVVSDSLKEKLLGWLVMIPGLALIYLTHKRGTFLAMAAMLLMWLAYRLPRLRYLLVAAFLAAALLLTMRGLDAARSLPRDNLSRISKLHRLELYPFALHVFKKHPWFGIGLRPNTHDRYLVDYEPKNLDAQIFSREVKTLQTFDNLLVTFGVELGSLMTLIYLGLIGYIIVNYVRRVRPFKESHGQDFVRLLPLAGLAVHSLTYDTLLFPPLNWLFHVQLGILAAWSHGPDR